MYPAKKRQASVPGDIVEHGEYLYTTLDLASPSCLHGASYGGTGSCQRHYIGIPKGWELAPWEEGHAEMLTQKKWDGAECTIFKNGCSVRNHPHMLIKKMPVGVFDMLDDARILIRTHVESHPTEKHSEMIVDRLWKKRRLTDFAVVCAGREIPCHRAVIAEASPVFEAALTGSMREVSEGRFEIQGAEPNVVEGMLFFLYKGELEKNKADATYLVKLLTLADLYGVKALVLACARPLMGSLCPANVVTVTRALRQLKVNDEPLWAELQTRLQEDKALLDAVLSDV